MFSTVKSLNTNHIQQLIDTALVLLACSLSYKMRFDSFIIPADYLLPTVVYMLFSTLSLLAVQHYKNNHPSYSIRIKTAFLGLFLAALSTSMFLYLTKSGQEFSRIWLLLTVLSSLLLITLSSVFISLTIRKSIGSKKIILLGSNKTADKINKNLSLNSQRWLSVIKQFSTFKNYGLDIVEYIETQRSKANVISEIWITHDVFSSISTVELNSAFNNSSVNLVFIPELPNSKVQPNSSIEYIEGIPTLDSQLSDTHRVGRTVKYLEDKLISMSLLIVIWPLLLIIALLIKLDSKGPILFKQTRYGANGHEFSILKFRTMNAEESNASFVQAVENDPRITKFGKFLRRTSLDELPQLFNVLKGDMSLVGPRPHPSMLNEQYRSSINGYMHRHLTKPGITGLAQINGARGETKKQSDMEKRLKYDLEYIQNWNLLLDLKIIYATAKHIITDNNAY